MTNLESSNVTVAKSAEHIFNFLQDLTNFSQLLPEDRVENFEADKDSCSFQIKGLTGIQIKVADRQPNTLVHTVSQTVKPFPFSLDMHIEAIDENSCHVQFKFHAEINSFLKMMVERPLGNFLGMLATSVQELNA